MAGRRDQGYLHTDESENKVHSNTHRSVNYKLLTFAEKQSNLKFEL